MKHLKPTEHHHVYDLVREAGIDVSDWANYKRSESPASNPKYCYNWSFEGPEFVVVCLWFQEMEPDGNTLFQTQNYRKIAASPRNWNPAQRKRAQGMDLAIQLARNKQLPVRVIVVDGSLRNDDNDDTRSSVERRSLDPEPWHVAEYNDDGNCRLQRGMQVAKVSASNSDSTHKLARIAYNTAEWRHPTGEASEQESGETYNAENKFGHEDWLFRHEWEIDGWRYAFIQGFNRGADSYAGRFFDVTLFTRLPDKRHQLVATIYGVEALSESQADWALEQFKNQGWLKAMEDEIRAAKGKPSALYDSRWSTHVLNVRFRRDNVDDAPKETYLPDDDWTKNRRRYMLYNFEGIDRDRTEQSFAGRSGTQNTPNTGRLFRRGSKPLTYTPEHNRMQAKLLVELQQEHGTDCVWLEKDYVDVRVEKDDRLEFYEIKTDLSPRVVIRQALGQLLEYAYHPSRTGRMPDKLVIVGRCKLETDDESYLKQLTHTFDLPLSYLVVSIE